jgi:hypothetical protein
MVVVGTKYSGSYFTCLSSLSHYIENKKTINFKHRELWQKNIDLFYIKWLYNSVCCIRKFSLKENRFIQLKASKQRINTNLNFTQISLVEQISLHLILNKTINTWKEKEEQKQQITTTRIKTKQKTISFEVNTHERWTITTKTPF